ncbi:hypothetical protein HAX54_007345, partial [Datura stramonium]|nr:hypothetical protein [Datura stramonium]
VMAILLRNAKELAIDPPTHEEDTTPLEEDPKHRRNIVWKECTSPQLLSMRLTLAPTIEFAQKREAWVKVVRQPKNAVERRSSPFPQRL